MILRTFVKNSRGHRPSGGRAGAGLRRRAVCAAAAAAWLFAAAFTGGCTRDLTDSGGFGPRPDTGDDYATLQLVVPGVSSAETRAAGVEQETLIEAGKLHVLLYARNGKDTWYFVGVSTPGKDDIRGPQTAENGHATYDIRIPFPAGNLDLTFRAGLVAGLTIDEVKQLGGYTKVDGVELWPNFANIKVDEKGNQVENPLADARLLLTFDSKEKWPVPHNNVTDFRSFPMWGESRDPFLLRPGTTIATTIRMTRAVARVDVGVNFKKNADGHFPLNDMKAQGLLKVGRGTYFELESVSVYRTAKGGVCGAQEGKIDLTTGQVTGLTPGVFGTFGDNEPLRYRHLDGELTAPAPADAGADAVATAANQRCLTRQCYVPETKNHELEFDDAACIVVGGKYGSAAANTTYYRIDFAEKRMDPDGGGQLRPTPDSRIDLLRNHAYVVNITSVAGHGEQTEEEALKNQNTNLSAEVVDWDQSQQIGDIVTDGVYTLSVDRSEQKYYCDGTAETFTVKTDYDGKQGRGWKLTLEGDGDFLKNIRYYDAKGAVHAPGSPEWPSKGTTGITQLRFGMTELTTNPGDPERVLNGRLVFEAGRMKTQVRITQTSRDLLRVLFDPEELYFGPEGPQKSVGISVTTKKNYVLTLAGTTAGNKKYEYQLHPTPPGTNPDDQFKTFFAKVRDAQDEYLVEPTKLPVGNEVRVFTFEVTAHLADNPAVKSEPERFTVTQLKEPVEWKVVENTKYQYSELRQNKGYEILVEHNAQSVWPKIETTPSSLTWWFARGEAGADDKWLTNIGQWFGKKIENVATAYVDGLEFTLQPNPGLGRRSVTLQVESNTPGLSPREANLTITQKGKPLTLEPTIVTGPDGKTITKQSDPKDGNPGVYVLDHGYGAAGGAYTLSMTSTTNWLWYWNKDRGADVHDANMKLVAENWTTKINEQVPTTDHKNDGEVDQVWENVVSFSVPDFAGGGTAFDEAKKNQQQPGVPLGGVRTVVRELRNVHPELTADDMEENARQLHIRRELPAHTHTVQWPFDNMTSLNWALEKKKYDGAEFIFGTNASGTLTLTTGFTVAEQAQPNSEKTYTSTMGYDIFKQKFADMTKVPVTAESEADDPVFYKLRFTGRTANDAGTANKDVDEKRIYYTGTQMNVPLRNMETGQHYLSSGAHTLKLDFSNSLFNRVKVRVKAVLVNTSGTEDGVEDYLKLLNSTEPALAKEKKLYPTTDWDKGKAFESGDASKLIEFALEENNHKNMMYKVVVEYARHKGGGVYDETTWLEIADTKIYQDGKPYAGNVIWMYQPRDWGWNIMGQQDGPDMALKDTGMPVTGAGNMKWVYAAPFGANQDIWSNIVNAFKAANQNKTVGTGAIGPDALTGKSVQVSLNNGIWYLNGVSDANSTVIYFREIYPLGKWINLGTKPVTYKCGGTISVRIAGATFGWNGSSRHDAVDPILTIQGVAVNGANRADTWKNATQRLFLVANAGIGNDRYINGSCYRPYSGWTDRYGPWWGCDRGWQLGNVEYGKHYGNLYGWTVAAVWGDSIAKDLASNEYGGHREKYELYGTNPNTYWRNTISMTTTTELKPQQ